jgi:hypothetical protein
MKAINSCRPGNLRKDQLASRSSQWRRGQASADKSARPAASPSRLPANGELRRRDYARARGDCAPFRTFIRAGLERSPLHDVRQHAQRGPRGRTHLGNLKVRIDALLDEPRYCGRSNAMAWGTSAGTSAGSAIRAPNRSVASHPVASLVEPDGIEPTTSCLQSRRSPN